MHQNSNMQDQVTNKVEGIMNHYKKKPIDGIMKKLKQIIKKRMGMRILINLNSDSG